MIYTTTDYVTRRNHDIPFNGDDAQTVASWWYSTGAPGMVTFVTRGQITPSLVNEVRAELDSPNLTSGEDRADLSSLLAFVESQGVDPV